jgi:hypothetical protein
MRPTPTNPNVVFSIAVLPHCDSDGHASFEAVPSADAFRSTDAIGAAGALHPRRRHIRFAVRHITRALHRTIDAALPVHGHPAALARIMSPSLENRRETA